MIAMLTGNHDNQNRQRKSCLFIKGILLAEVWQNMICCVNVLVLRFAPDIMNHWVTPSVGHFSNESDFYSNQKYNHTESRKYFILFGSNLVEWRNKQTKNKLLHMFKSLHVHVLLYLFFRSGSTELWIPQAEQRWESQHNTWDHWAHQDACSKPVITEKDKEQPARSIVEHQHQPQSLKPTGATDTEYVYLPG